MSNNVSFRLKKNPQNLVCANDKYMAKVLDAPAKTLIKKSFFLEKDLPQRLL